MANLSNINNILRTNSTGVGIFADAGSYPLEISSTTTAGVKLINTGNATYDIYANASEELIIAKSGIGNRLTISSGGDATFAGSITTAGANLFYLGKGVYTKATNASNDVDSTNIWGYGLYEGATILGELSTIRDGTVTLNLGTTYTAGKVVIRTDNKVTALTLDSSQNSIFSGNVGIGITPSLAGVKLHTYNNSTNAYNIFESSTRKWVFGQVGNVAQVAGVYGVHGGLEVDGATGNVGIGTSSPGSKLVLNTNAVSPGSMLELNSRGDITVGSWSAIRFGLDSNTYPNLYGKGGIIYESRDGYYRGKLHLAVNNSADTSNVALADSILTVDGITGNVGIGTSSPVQPLTVAGNVLFRTTTADGYENRFQFIPGGSGDAGNFYVYNDTETPRVRLNAAGDSYFVGGDLGVGETSPSQKLNVREDGGSDVFRGIEVHNNNTSLARAGIAFQCYDWVQSAIWHGRSTTAAYGGALVLGTNPNTSDLTVSGVTGRMWILNNGDVGIGTNSPKAKLDVFRAAGQSSVCAISITTGESNNRSWGLSTEVRAAGDFALLVSPSASTIPAPTDDNIRMYMTSGGDVAFAMNDYNSGPSASNYGLRLLTGATGKSYWQSAVNAATSHYHYEFINTNGSVGTIQTSGSATSYVTNSDYRLKEDLQDFNGLDKVSKIPVYNFKWKIDDTRSYGVMAHELQEVLPQAVVGEKDAEEMQGVDYSKIVPLLVKSIQELEARLKILENK